MTFISLALRRGVKPGVVSKMVGHTSPLITLRIYRHIYADELEDARGLVSQTFVAIRSYESTRQAGEESEKPAQEGRKGRGEVQ